MIKYFTVENFGSIKTENILEFDANLAEDCNFIAHPSIGFAGANGSGKTTILQCLTFIFWFMQHSFLRLEGDEIIPYEPFYTLKVVPTRFHLIFAKNDGNQIVEYEYQLETTQEKVLKEELYYSFSSTPQLAYRRQENQVEFGDGTSPIDTKDLRPNCSLISFATQFASQEIAKACKSYKIQSNVSYEGLQENTHKKPVLVLMEELKEIVPERILEFLKIADVGIVEVCLKDVNNEDISSIFLEGLEKKTGLPALLLEKLKKHTQNEKILFKSVFFKHQIDSDLADFTPDMESAGTLQFLSLLHNVLRAFSEGGVLIIDEIEIKLHQNLVAYLIGLFQNPTENPKGAQLIFSFHNSFLMEFLTPEQLWFAEKNDQGQTELFSAAHFDDLKGLMDKNLEELYRIGRFGAKPRGI